MAWADHLEWLSRRLARNQPHLYIATRGAEPVGTFRVDDGEISYTVAPEHCFDVSFLTADLGSTLPTLVAARRPDALQLLYRPTMGPRSGGTPYLGVS